MKSKDIFVVIMIGVFSSVISIVVSNIFIGGDENRNDTVEVIPIISTELQRSSGEYFNSESINPTQTIQIGGEASPQPFGSQ